MKQKDIKKKVHYSARVAGIRREVIVMAKRRVVIQGQEIGPKTTVVYEVLVMGTGQYLTFRSARRFDCRKTALTD